MTTYTFPRNHWGTEKISWTVQVCEIFLGENVHLTMDFLIIEVRHAFHTFLNVCFTISRKSPHFVVYVMYTVVDTYKISELCSQKKSTLLTVEGLAEQKSFITGCKILFFDIIFYFCTIYFIYHKPFQC